MLSTLPTDVASIALLASVTINCLQLKNIFEAISMRKYFILETHSRTRSINMFLGNKRTSFMQFKELFDGTLVIVHWNKQKSCHGFYPWILIFFKNSEFLVMLFWFNRLWSSIIIHWKYHENVVFMYLLYFSSCLSQISCLLFHFYNKSKKKFFSLVIFLGFGTVSKVRAGGLEQCEIFINPHRGCNDLIQYFEIR